MQATRHDCGGYSADTEILTRHQGWVTFDRLTYFDEVATRSPDGRFEWQHPERITWEPYDGDMVWFHGRGTDVLVTPGHRMLWMPDARSEERAWSAGAILHRAGGITRARAAGCIPAMSGWDVPDLPEKVFLGIRHTKMGPAPRSIRMSGDQYAAFMGMYVAEGNATSSKNDWLTMISQTPGGKGYAEYRHALTEIFGREPGKGNYGTTWVMHSRALYDHLAPLGKARNKMLPPDVMDLSRRQIGIFWRYYWLGDGSFAGGTHQVVATASKRLADQLQEIMQKLGSHASVRAERTRPNGLVKSSSVIYKLGARRAAAPAFSVCSAPYSGMAGRAQVPNSIVYVRRNGHPAWSG